MILEINKLIGSEFDILKKLGWLLYNREEKGLTEEELDKLLHIVTVEEMQKEYQAGYDEGLNDAVCK